jgi:trigger factor
MSSEADTNPAADESADQGQEVEAQEAEQEAVADTAVADEDSGDLDSGDLDAEIVDDELEQDEDIPLTLDITVTNPSACERHVVVKIAAEDIQRYKDDAFDELVTTAQVPGFRPGNAPRKLVEKRFRDEVSDQIKGSLIMDAMTQVSDQEDFSAISEPQFDFDAVQVEDDGPLTFEFNVEVRPEFEMPQWQGLQLERIEHEYSDEDVTDRTNHLLRRYGDLDSHDSAIEADDLVTINIVFSDGDEELSRLEETRCPVQDTLVFRDGQIAGFADAMSAAGKGKTVSSEAVMSESHQNEGLRGKSVQAEITITEVERIQLPELTDKFLQDVGGFKSADDMRDVVRDELQRQLEYHRDQRTRTQITDLLTESADWELPQAMLKRQSQRELQRTILELQSSGFSNDEIRMHMNRLQHDLMGSTEKALKEHFILERIAEEHELEASHAELDMHIELLARQQNVPARRIRARLDKQGDMDAVRNQIVERKAIALIMDKAEFTDVPLEEDVDEDSFAVAHDIGGKIELQEEPVAQPAQVTEAAEPAEVADAEPAETEEAAEPAETEEAAEPAETEEAAEPAETEEAAEPAETEEAAEPAETEEAAEPAETEEAAEPAETEAEEAAEPAETEAEEAAEAEETQEPEK